jgi:hypothetical protein
MDENRQLIAKYERGYGGVKGRKGQQRGEKPIARQKGDDRNFLKNLLRVFLRCSARRGPAAL